MTLVLVKVDWTGQKEHEELIKPTGTLNRKGTMVNRLRRMSTQSLLFGSDANDSLLGENMELNSETNNDSILRQIPSSGKLRYFNSRDSLVGQLNQTEPSLTRKQSVFEEFIVAPFLRTMSSRIAVTNTVLYEEEKGKEDDENNISVDMEQLERINTASNLGLDNETCADMDNKIGNGGIVAESQPENTNPRKKMSKRVTFTSTNRKFSSRPNMLASKSIKQGQDHVIKSGSDSDDDSDSDGEDFNQSRSALLMRTLAGPMMGGSAGGLLARSITKRAIFCETGQWVERPAKSNWNHIIRNMNVIKQIQETEHKDEKGIKLNNWGKVRLNLQRIQELGSINEEQPNLDSPNDMNQI